ncbi:MAG: hypothetical protein IH999_09560 [Proteobacteria bacterium]|nr:hypothetical protein [Pseudomonadota bacterium]
MTQGTLTLSAVGGRLERLEKQNRRLKYAGAAILLLISAVLLMGQVAPVPEGIAAREFIVLDAYGTPRAILTATESGGGLSLHDPDGNVRALLISSEEGTVLTLFDADGTERVMLEATEGGPGLYLRDANENLRVGLALIEAEPALGLFDANGRPLFLAP